MTLELTDEEVRAVHHALYLRLCELSMVEDHNPDQRRRQAARSDAAPVLAVADRLLPFVQ